MLSELKFIPLALGALFLSAATTGCASFKLKDSPPGFIEVSESKWDGDAELRMKAPDNVGLNITSFPNRAGGKLPLWSDDLVKKFAARGYTLTNQRPVESRNGVAGTRFDFRYSPPGSEKRKFYTAVLFVTDEWRVVVQLAGEAGLASDHDTDLDGILRQIRVRGCKLGEDTCKGPQPTSFTAVASAKVATEADTKDAVEDDPSPKQPEPKSADDAPAPDQGDPPAK